MILRILTVNTLIYFYFIFFYVKLFKKKIWLTSFCVLLLAQFTIYEAFPQAATAVIPIVALPLSPSGLWKTDLGLASGALRRAQALAFAMQSF